MSICNSARLNSVYVFFLIVLDRLQQIDTILFILGVYRRMSRLSSREGQSIALSIAMLIVLTAATVHLHSRAQARHAAPSQVDVLTMMAHVGSLPVETPPSP